MSQGSTFWLALGQDSLAGLARPPDWTPERDGGASPAAPMGQPSSWCPSPGIVLDVVLYLAGMGALATPLAEAWRQLQCDRLPNPVLFRPPGVSPLHQRPGSHLRGAFRRLLRPGVLDLIRVVQPTRLSTRRAPRRRSLVLTSVLLVLFSVGALYYFSQVYQPRGRT